MIAGLSLYFILMDFYIFAFAGWIYECTFVFLRDRKFVNRGFLVGTILPLYGFGAVLVYILLRPFAEVASLLYIMGMIIATVIEYITSWLLEVVFHAKWWDYSKEPYNFQGRIALIPSLFWGILSLLMFDVLQPAASFIIGQIPEEIGKLLLGIAILLTVADVAYTVITTFNFRKQLENLYEFRKELEYFLQDIKEISMRDILNSTTKELAEKILSMGIAEGKELLKRAPRLRNQRLLHAFPTMKIITKNRSAVEARELLFSLKQKAVRVRKKAEAEPELQTVEYRKEETGKDKN